MTHFILYSTSGCHLCEQAKAMLERLVRSHPVQWHEQDIAESDPLIERYGIRIPVLQNTTNQEELSWPFEQDALAAWLVQQNEKSGAT